VFRDCSLKCRATNSCYDLAEVKHRVLLVDDDRSMTEACAILLSLDGHECRSAHTGLEALEVALEFEPDIVVLDLQLPELSGFEVARALRARAGLRRLYLAAVSGRDVDDVALLREAGFDEHILKPVDASALKAIIRKAEGPS
jgi:DNA-binding response OmpR family regulator